MRARGTWPAPPTSRRQALSSPARAAPRPWMEGDRSARLVRDAHRLVLGDAIGSLRAFRSGLQARADRLDWRRIDRRALHGTVGPGTAAPLEAAIKPASRSSTGRRRASSVSQLRGLRFGRRAARRAVPPRGRGAALEAAWRVAAPLAREGRRGAAEATRFRARRAPGRASHAIPRAPRRTADAPRAAWPRRIDGGRHAAGLPDPLAPTAGDAPAAAPAPRSSAPPHGRPHASGVTALRGGSRA